MIFAQKKHCPQCLCSGCSRSLADGFVIHDNLKYCTNCKPGDKQNSSNRQQETTIEYCALCNKDLGDGTVLVFNDKQYHSTCFVCYQCKKSFGHEKVYQKDNKNYCGKCIAGTCSRCLKAIGGVPAFEVGGKTYHESCFSCSDCGMHLPDGMCNLVNNNPYCSGCAGRMKGTTNTSGAPSISQGPSGVCGKCKSPFNGDFIGIAELSNSYHKECFCCSRCNSSLSYEGCQVFVNSDKPYCRACMQVLSQGGE